MSLLEIKKIGQFTANVSHLNRMCQRINDEPQRVYEIMQEYGTPFTIDSYTRESIFSYIADKYHNGNYNRVYKRWLA
jgi:hypothetical protein